MALKESRIFTVGTFYGNKDLVALNYCYPIVNPKGVLKWRTRVWRYWRNSKSTKIASRISKLVANGMVFMTDVKQGQDVSTAQQEILRSCGLLDHVQPMLNNRFKPIGRSAK